MSANSQFDLHPDADSLNGFMEHALPDAERAQIVSHLASCSRCREIVYLAQDAAHGSAATRESSATASPRGGDIAAVLPNSWFWRWKLAWATAAVAFASVVAVSIHVLNRPTVEQRQIATATPEPATKISAPAAQMSTPAPAAARHVAPVGERAPFAVHGTSDFTQKMLSKPLGSASGAAGGIVASNHSSLKQAPAPAPAPAILIQPATSDSILQAYSGKAPKASAYRAVPSAPAATGLHSLQAGPQGQVAQQAQAPQQASVQSFDAQPSSQPSGQPARQPAITNVSSATPAPALTTQTVEVNSEQVQLEPETPKTARLTAGSLRSRAKASLEKKAAPIKLPSGLPATSTAASRRIMLAVDAAGALFLSSDSGQNWEPVSRQWSGRAVRVRIILGGSDSSSAAASGAPARADSSSGIAGIDRADADLAGPAANFHFEIVNDGDSIWTSTDGKTWKPKQN
jgi:hypothetical protein